MEFVDFSIYILFILSEKKLFITVFYTVLLLYFIINNEL